MLLTKSQLGWLRIIGFCEGCSFLMLFVTMPLKYIWGLTGPNYVVGMAHGILFIVYMALVWMVGSKYRWDFRTLLISWIVAFVPFGTFYADHKIFSQQAA